MAGPVTSAKGWLLQLRNSRSAFTLIELLVVLSIVTTLVALLLPAISKAKEIARLVACGANQHSIFVAASAYTADNRTELPTRGGSWSWSMGIGDPKLLDEDNFARASTVYSSAVDAPFVGFIKNYTKANYVTNSGNGGFDDVKHIFYCPASRQPLVRNIWWANHTWQSYFLAGFQSPTYSNTYNVTYSRRIDNIRPIQINGVAGDVNIAMLADMANHANDMNVAHADGSVKAFKITDCYRYQSFYTYLQGVPTQGYSYLPNGYVADLGLPGNWATGNIPYAGVYFNHPTSGTFMSVNTQTSMAAWRGFGYVTKF